MQKSLLLIITILSLYTKPVAAQGKTLSYYGDTLQSLAITFLTNRDVKARQKACDQFLPLIQEALKQDASFKFNFDSLTGACITYATDSTFRMFTWQLYVAEDNYRYYGVIQPSNPTAELIILNDKSDEVADPEYDILSADNWYGAIYYTIQDFDTPTGKKYLIFGKDGFDLFNRRKIMDVLSFENGQAVFGEEIFATIEEGRRPRTQSRVLLEYSAEIAISLNYDKERDMVIYDHLINAKGRYPGQGPTLVTDGSYEGYEYKDGLWVHVEKVFDQISEEAPREQPVLYSRSKDIMGRGNDAP